jgi:hypothetical protein
MTETNNNNNDNEAAHRLYEQQYFQEGSRYGSRADFHRDMRNPRYKSDVAFRSLVDAKLERSLLSPSFDRMPDPTNGTKSASVIGKRDRDTGELSYQAATGGDVPFQTVRDSNPEAKDDGPKVMIGAGGNLSVGVSKHTIEPIHKWPTDGLSKARRMDLEKKGYGSK